MKEQSEDMLIKQILAGNGRVFESLVRMHQDMVFNIIIRIVGNREDAEELAQDVFLKVYQALPSFKMEAKFSTWLYRIAYNTAISWTRKSRVEFNVIDENAIENFKEDSLIEIELNEEESKSEQQQKNVKEAIAGLKEEEKLLLNMFYYNELSIKEISKILRINESNVKIKLFRLRNKLKSNS